MNIDAINKIRQYIAQGKWHSYMVVFPTRQLVQKFIDLLFAEEVAGVFYPKIFTFESLVEEILSKKARANNYISDIYKLEMLKNIISNLQARGLLKYIKKPPRHGILNYINEIIVELKQAAINPAQFTSAVKSIDNLKLNDLALIYEKYLGELEEKGLKDREDRFLEVLDILEKDEDFFTGVEYIYMAGFMDNTPIQEKIFTLISHQIPNADIDLVKNISVYPDKVAIHNARGYEGEVIQALHEVIRWLENGVAPEDIAIVARNPQIYAALLMEYFSQVNIKLDIDLKKPLIDNPLSKTLMWWFNILAHPERNFRLDLVLNNHYLVEITDIPQELLNWCLEKGSHTLEEWIYLWQTEAEDLLNLLGDAYNIANNLIDKIRSLNLAIVREGLATDIITSIINNLENLKVDLKIKTFNPGAPLEKRINLFYRENQALDAWFDILHNLQLTEVDSPINTSMAALLNKINNYLNDFTYIDKQGDRRGIAVLAPTEIRHLDYHRVLVLGMEEGQFPKKITPNPLLRDNERILLGPQIDLPLTREIYEREQLLFNLILQASREEIIFTYPETDDEGQANLASLFMGDILRANPEAQKVTPYNPPRNEIQEKRGIAHLLQVENERNSNIFSRYEGCFTQEKLLNMIAEQNRDKVFSISTLNDYAKCPLKYFFMHELDLKDKAASEDGLSKLDLGSLKHEVLALVLGDYRILTANNLAEAVTNTLERVCSKRGYAGQDYPHIWLWELEKSNIIESLTTLLGVELERSTFTPHLLEWSFGFKEAFYIENEGKKYFFKGLVDRIDIDNENHLAIYDYKESAYMSRLDIMEARELQLPLYIMAAEKFIGEVIGTSYIEIKNAKPKHFFYKEDYKKQLGQGRATTKPLNTEEWQEWLNQVKRQISNYIDNINIGQFPPIPYDCTHCHLHEICLYKVARTRNKLGKGASE